MKRSTIINISVIAGIILILIVLNIVFFVDEGGQEDELTGDRSSYSARSYGTRAFYTLLEELNRPVLRWREPFTMLKKEEVDALVLISPSPFALPSADELKSLDEWVQGGGWLFIIDREVDISFGDVKIKTKFFPKGPEGVRILQPSVYTQGVNSFKLSPYASRFQISGPGVVTLMGDKTGAVLADFSYGEGHVVLLSDPFPVANNGIMEADNYKLALNIINSAGGDKIAFDEYHHGYGEVREGLRAYFRNTPVPWIAGQALLIAVTIIYTRGRRFARPIPLRRDDRASSLEFVSSMANIQRLAKASDLAIENIYLRLKPRLCRYCGLPTTATTRQIAEAVARRAPVSAPEIKRILDRCEGALAGSNVNENELLSLIKRLRQMQAEIGC